MCGICGIVTFEGAISPQRPVLENMTAALAHRGPDAEGSYEDRNCLLGHKRLSIIDLQAGNQPMDAMGGRFRIVYNGEIYNFPEIRTELEREGVNFRTKSDTEVILKGYISHREKILRSLNGIFAFAIWDTKERTIFLARDHLGIKPLYYADTGDHFIFGSEIKSVLASGMIAKQVNPNAIFEYLCRQSPPYLETMFKNVYEIEPGSCMLIEHTGLQRKEIYYKAEDAWYDIGADELPSQKDLLCYRLRDKLDSSVTRQLVSDVPVGISLSSGIDSGLVFHYMCKRYHSEDLHAFTYANEEVEINEEGGASLMVKEMGKKVHHHILPVSLADNLKVFDRACKHFDAPVSYQSSMPILHLCRLAKEKGIKVLMSAQGADEIFLGYLRYARWLSVLSSEADLRIWAKHFYFGGGIEKADWVERITNRSKETAEDSPVWQWVFANAHLPPLKRMALFDQRFRLLHLLKRDDRMGMSSGVEVRVPFLDRHFMTWANAIPDEWKIRNGKQKYILHKAADSLLPMEIVSQSKKGSPTSIQTWLQSWDFTDYLKRLVTRKDSFTLGHLRPDMVMNLLLKHEKEFSFEHLAWCIFSLERWYRSTILDTTYPNRTD